MQLRSITVLWSAILACALGGASSGVPPIQADPPASPRRVVTRSMDPFLLGARTGPLTVESDWVSGCKPNDSTIAALLALLEKVRGSSPVLLPGSEIARSRWQAAAPITLRPLIENNATLSTSD